MAKLVVIDADEDIIIENGTIKATGDVEDDTVELKLGNETFVLTVSLIEVIADNTDVGTLDPGEYRLIDGTIIIVE